jgi:hypothetical protein
MLIASRDTGRSDCIVVDLWGIGSTKIGQYVLEINDLRCRHAVLHITEQILDEFDIGLITHTALSEQTAFEQSLDINQQVIKVSSLSVIVVLIFVANRFEAQRKL